jgi:Domain of unknown function (DUF5753)
LHEYRDVLDGLPNWVEIRVELEQAASLIRSYETQCIPALLQTEEYARAVMRVDQPNASRFAVDRQVSLLLRRQQALRRPGATRLWTVIHEAALRRRLGSATMRDQLAHLIEIVAAGRGGYSPTTMVPRTSRAVSQAAVRTGR